MTVQSFLLALKLPSLYDFLLKLFFDGCLSASSMWFQVEIHYLRFTIRTVSAYRAAQPFTVRLADWPIGGIGTASTTTRPFWWQSLGLKTDQSRSDRLRFVNKHCLLSSFKI